MSDTEVNITIVALVISLVALLVTGNQLLVQIFSSANGYRQCAESVIGSWHTRRKRVWKWSEFRFETQYVTPQIVLLDQSEFASYLLEGEKIGWINGRDMRKDACTELDRTLHEYMFDHRGRRKRIVDHPRITRELEKGIISAYSGPSKRHIKTRSEHQVTWLQLLRQLHFLAHSYWPDVCYTCSKLGGIELERGYYSQKSFQLSVSSNASSTDVAVIHRTWNWDFMPPDLTRPLAEMNIGDIVILALRMGMQWRVLDLDSGKMQADGNGLNITGFEARGLGIILRLTATERQEYPRLIPSRAVDKMLLGILPGDPDLVRHDFPLIMMDRSVQPLADPRGILAAIGMSDEKRHQIAQMNYIHVRIDVITLLCAYLPLAGCTMTKYCFPGWNSNPSFRNVYRYWEGRLALHRALRERILKGVSKTKLHDVLSTILAKMDYLEKCHGDDWYCRWEWRPSIRNGREVEDKKQCMAEVRDVYQWTQAWWLTSDGDHGSEARRTYYVQFVAAHAYMASHACQDAQSTIKTRNDEYRVANGRHESKEDARKRYDIDTSKQGHWFVVEEYEFALHYIKHLHHDQHGIKTYLRERNIDLTDDEIEAAWWVMQLRGIAWHFSTWHTDTVVKEIIGEQFIPSSFYGNKSPVWIT